MSEPFSNTNDRDIATTVQELDSLLKEIGVTGESAEFKKDVNMLPKHGVYFRWPAEDEYEWVHPEDRELIE